MWQYDNFVHSLYHILFISVSNQAVFKDEMQSLATFCRAAEVQLLKLRLSCLPVANLNIIHNITIWLFLPNHPVYCILNCNEFPGVCLCLR